MRATYTRARCWFGRSAFDGIRDHAQKIGSCSPAIDRRGEAAGVLKGNCASATCCSSLAGQAKACRPKAYAWCWGRPLDLKAMYPLLGPGVASAALQAGIPHSSLGALRGLLDKGAG